MKYKLGDLVFIEKLKYPKDEINEDGSPMELPFEAWDWMVHNYVSGFGIIYEEDDRKYRVWHPEAENSYIDFWKEKYDVGDEQTPEAAACYHHVEERLKVVS